MSRGERLVVGLGLILALAALTARSVLSSAVVASIAPRLAVAFAPCEVSRWADRPFQVAGAGIEIDLDARSFGVSAPIDPAIALVASTPAPGPTSHPIDPSRAGSGIGEQFLPARETNCEGHARSCTGATLAIGLA